MTKRFSLTKNAIKCNNRFLLQNLLRKFFSRNDKCHDVDEGGGIGRAAPNPAYPPDHTDRVIPTERRNLLHSNYLQKFVISTERRNLLHPNYLQELVISICQLV
jgi:hypothetical protein